MKVYAVVEHCDNNESYPEDRMWSDMTLQIFSTKEKALEFVKNYKPDEDAYDETELDEATNKLKKFFEDHKNEPVNGFWNVTYEEYYHTAEKYASSTIQVMHDNTFIPDDEHGDVRTFWIKDHSYVNTYTYEIKEWEVL